MFFQNHYHQTVGTIVAVLMGAMMSFACIFVDDLPRTLPTFFNGWGLITLIVLLVSFTIPGQSLGEKFTTALGIKKGTLSFLLVANLIPSLINNTFCTLGGAAVSAFSNSMLSFAEQGALWMKMCLRDWPVMLVISYIASLLAQQAGVAVAKKNT